MFKLEILDLTTNQVFTKIFNSYYLMRKFYIKCKYSKKIKIIGLEYPPGTEIDF